LKMGCTKYASLHSRDVNNYLAFGAGGEVERKGVFSNKRLGKNPHCKVCAEAVENYLKSGKPLDATIYACDDVRKFLVVRTVKTGAAKSGEYLGKVVRWYYGKSEIDAIYYNTNGNKVAESMGGIPLMVLPETLPSDVDYEYYIAYAKKMLKGIGLAPPL